MAGTLIIAEHLQGQLRDVTRECVTAASELEGPVVVGVVGGDPAAVADQANVSGVDEVVTVTVDEGEFSADAYVAAAEALVAAKQPSVVLDGIHRKRDGLCTGARGAARSRLRVGCGGRPGRRRARRRAGDLRRQSPRRARVPGQGDDGAHAARHDLAAGRGSGQRRGQRARRVDSRVAIASPRVRRGGEWRRRHHDGGLPPLGRPWHRREGEHRAVRGAGREDGRDPRRLAAARRRRLDARLATGRAVGQDGQAEGLPRVRHLGRGAAPRRHEDVRDDHRGEHRPGGGDLQHRRTTAPSPTSSTSPRNSRSSTERSSRDDPCRFPRPGRDVHGGGAPVGGRPRGGGARVPYRAPRRDRGGGDR